VTTALGTALAALSAARATVLDRADELAEHVVRMQAANPQVTVRAAAGPDDPALGEDVRVDGRPVLTVWLATRAGHHRTHSDEPGRAGQVGDIR
jgi:hypothetical protein